MLKLLSVGDIHLGRRPARLPDDLRGRARDLGPAGAWSRITEAALGEQVDVVALAGDVVEREHDFFEAYRQLHRGVAQLTEAGIRVLGIAGNHDVHVLPRLSDEIRDFQLVGRNGCWEKVQVEARGESVALWGWSFPRARVTESPLAGFRFEREPGCPNLGLLHCDRDRVGGPYAPISSRELEMAGLDGWLLGHIHKPDTLTPATLSGYLGSVAGMDSGEPGVHGPWLITVEGHRIVTVEQWGLAPLRWELLEVDLTGITEPHDAHRRFLDALRKLDAALSGGRWVPEAVGLRVNLIGRSRFGEEVRTLISEEDAGHIYDGEADTHYFIERLVATNGPEISLQLLAERPDPAGLLASRLLLLDHPADNAERQALLAGARHRLEAQARDLRWSGLHVAPPDEESVARFLRHAGMRLLERMVAQQTIFV